MLGADKDRHHPPTIQQYTRHIYPAAAFLEIDVDQRQLRHLLFNQLQTAAEAGHWPHDFMPGFLESHPDTQGNDSLIFDNNNPHAYTPFA
jgi:hypothetical protein